MDTPQLILKAVNLTSSGQHDKAEQIIKKVLSKAPDNFDALHASALIDIGKSQGGRALKKLRQLEAPASPQQRLALLNTFGLAYEQKGDLEAAADVYQRAYDAQPESYEAGMNLAHCLEALERFEGAAKICRFLLATFEGDVAARFLAITCLYKQGDRDTALDRYLALAREVTLSVKQLEQLGNLLVHHYRYDELRTLVNSARQHYPEASSLAIFLAKCEIEAENYSAAASVLEAATRHKTPRSLQTDLYHELALVRDRAGDYEAAYRHFEQTNAIHRQLSKSAGIRRSNAAGAYRKLLENWDLRSLENTSRPDAGADLCFLVGFPRSGTTLLERVLDSHSELYALPELNFLQKIIDELGGLDKYQARLPGLEEAELVQLEALYRRELANEIPQGQHPTLVVDKLPLNLIHAPLIHTLFPSARFILALRHPADCTLSSFMQNFVVNEEMAHFLSLEDACARYAEVFNLWNQYREYLPLQVHTLRYEDLVSGFDREVSDLMHFLGLDFESAQRDYHEKVVSEGDVKTPSYRQVSKPIYTSSSYRWKHYGFAVNQQLDILRPFIEQFGYGEA